MFEHVGPKNYAAYFQPHARLLADEGLFLLHTIGSDRTERATNAWTERYIFPNGKLPSAVEIARAAEGQFVIEDWHNFGPDYDRTLMAWWAPLRARLAAAARALRRALLPHVEVLPAVQRRLLPLAPGAAVADRAGAALEATRIPLGALSRQRAVIFTHPAQAQCLVPAAA